MNDQTIIKMAKGTCKVLFEVPWAATCDYLVPSYNFLLQAAKANHPGDPFLGILTPLSLNEEEDGPNGPQMNILFAQIRIALEALQMDSTPSMDQRFVES